MTLNSDVLDTDLRVFPVSRIDPQVLFRSPSSLPDSESTHPEPDISTAPLEDAVASDVPGNLEASLSSLQQSTSIPGEVPVEVYQGHPPLSQGSTPSHVQAGPVDAGTIATHESVQDMTPTPSVTILHPHATPVSSDGQPVVTPTEDIKGPDEQGGTRLTVAQPEQGILTTNDSDVDPPPLEAVTPAVIIPSSTPPVYSDDPVALPSENPAHTGLTSNENSAAATEVHPPENDMTESSSTPVRRHSIPGATSTEASISVSDEHRDVVIETPLAFVQRSMPRTYDDRAMISRSAGGTVEALIREQAGRLMETPARGE